VRVPTVTEDRDFDVTAECLDRDGVVVATATVRWRLGPVPPATSRYLPGTSNVTPR
jgi:hypothetical protein